jgi:hypothetical protein
VKGNPEDIFEALFETICGINTAETPLVTMSRRWVPWSAVGDGAMPAFFQMQSPGIEQAQRTHMGLNRYVLRASLFFYFAVSVADKDTPTSPALNAYYTAVDQILMPTIQSPSGNKQQLGGQVGIENAWIDGTVLFDEGLVNPPALLVFPIAILTG